MTSIAFPGSHRACAYLNPSEPAHCHNFIPSSSTSERCQNPTTNCFPKRFFTFGASILDEAEKLGIERHEAFHNLIFLLGFNAVGGMEGFVSGLIRWVGSAGVSLHPRSEGGVTMSALDVAHLGDLGKWIAFIAVVLRLFFNKRFPDWLQMPGALVLLIVAAPAFFAHTVKDGFVGIVICLLAGRHLLQEHIRASGGFRNSSTKSHGISNSVGIIILLVYPVWTLFVDFP